MDHAFVSLLKPYNIHQEKVRLGPNEDGGYVMTDYILKQCSALMTYGVGNDIRYEEEFSKKYDKPAYLFDHTIGKDSWSMNGLKFFPTGIGSNENCKEWYEDYKNLGLNEKVMLKIDVEGYEYEYFTTTDIDKLKDHVIGLCLEVHWIDNNENRKKLEEILVSLQMYFTLFHIHGNSWGDLWEFEGYKIPKVLELSFINNEHVDNKELDNQAYPIKGLDVSNCPHREDYTLDFLNLVK
jgi:hypothetical protein